MMLLEGALIPVVTAIAFYIQEAYNVLVDLLQEEEEAKLAGEECEEDEAREKRDEDLIGHGFILGELLKIAVPLDYSDEIGRRKVFIIVST
jgi:condensin complex subunit 3